MELLAILAVAFTVFGLVGGIPDPRRVKRLLARARLDPIDTLADGSSVTVRGTVTAIAADAVVVAPLTARRCVYWLVVFDELGAGGDYVELGRTETGVPFLLRGDTGTARVVPEKPRLALLGKTFVRTTGVFDRRMTDPLSALAQRVCKPPNHVTSFVRASEYAVEVDAVVTIRGWCTREPDPDAAEAVAGYREELPTRPVISGSRGERLMIA